MHKDTKKALARLEQELLEEDPLDPADEEGDIPVDDHRGNRKPAPRKVRFYNADRVDVDLEDYAHRVYQEPKKQYGVLIFSLITLALIAGVMIVWAVSML